MTTDTPPDPAATTPEPPDAGSSPNGADGGPTENERLMAMLCHLLAIFTNFIGPLVIWLIEREKSEFVNRHGKEVLNFMFTLLGIQIVLMIFMICGGIGIGAAGGGAVFGVLMCVLYPLMLAISIYALVMLIMGCVDANRGGFRVYPFKIEFLK